MLRIVLILAAVLALAGCASKQDDGKTHVVAAFYPLAFAAEEIGGTNVEVTNLVPPGVEPHDYELTPDDVKAVADADVILYVGGGFQPTLQSALHTSSGEKIDLLEGFDADVGDPHVWLDPELYAQMASRIGEALGAPNSAAAFAERLDELAGEYKAGLAKCDRRVFITSHAGFGYLARANRLHQTALTGPSGDAVIPTHKLGTLALIAKSSGTTTVFVQPLLPRDVAETLAHAGPFGIATLDPIESAADGQDYFSLMRANLAALRKGLGCRRP